MAEEVGFDISVYAFRINDLKGGKFKMLCKMLCKKRPEHYQR